MKEAVSLPQLILQTKCLELHLQLESRGCYNGELGKVLKSLRPNLYVAGVEIDERAAVIAKNFLDEIVVADIENF